ncbi:ferric reductase family protein [Aspergillus ibericus CBS 121593]|uniref:FAD-binding FR-type domain-containing protein n=1 Tax=Aspergillus ibericus CBS 121593 TaxID=1448316 RepID=A0A395HCA5_9EURO|nr:hypothetical protein BO80DRAFT_273198 [Aspergillus ibericus CBS 121593]RAL03864.1 hypothetical protein BO80DRAFT_273198 [Aspergillus ibericus CBS 121593]
MGDFPLAARHIQNYSAATTLEPHWGYADRALPCTSDAGSCAYLDVDYAAHDRGMLYTGILWATIGGILLIWACLNQFRGSGATTIDSTIKMSSMERGRRSLAAFSRRYLLPDAMRWIFGRTTRLQVLILVVLAGYLLIFSFVGIVYNTWVTPVSGMTGVYNTRTSLGPWADRVGVLAFALMPLSVLLSSRESFLSLITGLPYQSFNFLHRWLGYIIFVQSSLHTIGWCVVELRLYQPQPSVGIAFIKQTYIVWGIVAMILLLFLFALSTPWGIKLTGYETFRKLHYILAMVFIGACWGHWEQLKCFLLPSLIFWFLDRAARLCRTALLHYQPDQAGTMGCRPAEATITQFPDPNNGDVLRLDIDHIQDPWAVGQHYYLCFPQSSIWQSHPFTPLNAPTATKGKVRHSYILRAKGGETKKLASLAANGVTNTPVILTGAYGEATTEHLTPNTNILCIAGGTGITYVLPVLLECLQQHHQQQQQQNPPPTRTTELIWMIRHTQDTAWIKDELDLLQRFQNSLNLKIRIFATRDPAPMDEKSAQISASSSPTTPQPCPCGQDAPVKKLNDDAERLSKHPDLGNLVSQFLEETVQGPTTVFASGPGGMISDLRTIVASCNSGSKVWTGQERFDVRLMCDDRLEW